MGVVPVAVRRFIKTVVRSSRCCPYRSDGRHQHIQYASEAFCSTGDCCFADLNGNQSDAASAGGESRGGQAKVRALSLDIEEAFLEGLEAKKPAGDLGEDLAGVVANTMFDAVGHSLESPCAYMASAEVYERDLGGEGETSDKEAIEVSETSPKKERSHH